MSERYTNLAKLRREIAAERANGKLRLGVSHRTPDEVGTAVEPGGLRCRHDVPWKRCTLCSSPKVKAVP